MFSYGSILFLFLPYPRPPAPLIPTVPTVPTLSSPRYHHTDDHPSQPLHTRRALSTFGKLSSYFENVQLGNQSGYITVKEGPATTNDGDYWSSWKAVWTPTHCSKKNASENRCMSDIFRTFAKSSLKVLLVKIWGK